MRPAGETTVLDSAQRHPRLVGRITPENERKETPASADRSGGNVAKRPNTLPTAQHAGDDESDSVIEFLELAPIGHDAAEQGGRFEVPGLLGIERSVDRRTDDGAGD